MALGLCKPVSHCLSIAFLQAFSLLKQRYEADLQHADEACIKIALTRNALAPNFQDRMRSIYVSKFLDTVKSWTSEGMVAIQLRLLDVNIKSTPFRRASDIIYLWVHILTISVDACHLRNVSFPFHLWRHGSLLAREKCRRRVIRS